MRILDAMFGAEVVDQVFYEAVSDALVVFARAELPGVGPVFKYNGTTIDLRTEAVTGPEFAFHVAARDRRVAQYLAPILREKHDDIVQAALFGTLP